MHVGTFNQTVEEQWQRCSQVLVAKAEEYAGPVDRLHNFKVAATLLGGNPVQALAGMKVKHTVSLGDMVASGEQYPEALWNEKITDELNYGFLMAAAVRDCGLILPTHDHSQFFEPITSFDPMASVETQVGDRHGQ